MALPVNASHRKTPLFTGEFFYGPVKCERRKVLVPVKRKVGRWAPVHPDTPAEKHCENEHGIYPKPLPLLSCREDGLIRSYDSATGRGKAGVNLKVVVPLAPLLILRETGE